MRKSLLTLTSLICLLAVSGCQSSLPLIKVVEPNKLTVPPLPQWIKAPPLQKTSPQQLQEILKG